MTNTFSEQLSAIRQLVEAQGDHLAAADRGEVRYDPDVGWCQVLADPCAATEVALPTDCDVEVSALREGLGRAL